MRLTKAQIRRFFEKVTGKSIPDRQKVIINCLVHEDKNPSAAAFLDGNGGYNCMGCGFRGNLFQLAARLKGCSIAEAEGYVAELTGASPDTDSIEEWGPPIGVYDYRDAEGKVLYQKRKYRKSDGKKSYRIFRPDGDRWVRTLEKVGSLDKISQILYNLPSVLTANVIFLSEGEADADALAQHQPLYPEYPNLQIAFTTAPSGAWEDGQTAKWDPSWNAAFYQKAVIIFEDNDTPGRVYSEHIADQLYSIAHSVRIVRFSEMQEKASVKDWLDDHTKEQLVDRIRSTPRWEPDDFYPTMSEIFVSAGNFMSGEDRRLDWLVEGVIPRGANGFFAGTPKASKSFLCVDLCVSLATGTPWLGFNVPVPVRTGLVTREDHYALTRWRMRRLRDGKSLEWPAMLDENLWVNSRQQTPDMYLDNPENLTALIAAIRDLNLEIVFLDVFNVLHGADENDNTEMRKILNRCRQIQDESGAQVGICHHLNKELMGSVTQRLRGASAIAGYAEWIIGVSLKDEVERTREMNFELKAAAPPDPFEFKINEDVMNHWIRIEKTGSVTKKVGARGVLSSNGKTYRHNDYTMPVLQA